MFHFRSDGSRNVGHGAQPRLEGAHAPMAIERTPGTRASPVGSLGDEVIWTLANPCISVFWYRTGRLLFRLRTLCAQASLPCCFEANQRIYHFVYVLNSLRDTMPKRQVFYSFHFDNDVMRAQQIRNMGVVEGGEPGSAKGPCDSGAAFGQLTNYGSEKNESICISVV
jgi:hypothetical protein